MDTSIETNNQINLNSALQQKIDQLSKVNGKSVDGTNLSDKEKSDIAKASRGFESILVNMMFKEMKSSMLEKPEDGFGADTLSGYMDMMFSDYVSQNGNGIGLAQKIYQQLTGDSNLPPYQQLLSTVANNEQAANIIQPNNTINDTKNTIIYTNNNNFLNNVQKRLNNFDKIIDSASAKYDVPKNLIKAVIAAESAGKTDARSQAGAKGLMQLMDDTAREMGVNNVYDPVQNIDAGAKYLKNMLNKFDGNVNLALAAYNAGPGNVQKYSGIPPFSETQSYVKKVNNYFNSFEQQDKSNSVT